MAGGVLMILLGGLAAGLGLGVATLAGLAGGAGAGLALVAGVPGAMLAAALAGGGLLFLASGGLLCLLSVRDRLERGLKARAAGADAAKPAPQPAAAPPLAENEPPHFGPRAFGPRRDI